MREFLSPWIEDDINALAGERERLEAKKKTDAELQQQAAKAEKSQKPSKTFYDAAMQDMYQCLVKDLEYDTWQKIRAAQQASSKYATNYEEHVGYLGNKMAESCRLPQYLLEPYKPAPRKVLTQHFSSEALKNCVLPIELNKEAWGGEEVHSVSIRQDPRTGYVQLKIETQAKKCAICGAYECSHLKKP